MYSGIKQLLSMKVAIVLLFLFGAASGIATFVENDFGVETSWALIYTSKWFECLQVALALILIYNIIHFKIYTKDKLPSLLFHLSFIFILIGSGMTRYFGFEGSLHIRNGMHENRVISSESYISVSAQKDGKLYSVAHPQLISHLGGNQFSFKLNVGGETATVAFKEYLPVATKKVVDDANGVPMISMMLSGYGESLSISLKRGESYETAEYVFNFENKR